MARFEYIGMVAHNMAATLLFYRLLGMDIPAGVEQEDHVEAALPGFRVAWDTEALVRKIDPEWVKPVGQSVGIGFLCASPAEVDELYQRITRRGLRGSLSPLGCLLGTALRRRHRPQRQSCRSVRVGAEVGQFVWTLRSRSPNG